MTFSGLHDDEAVIPGSKVKVNLLYLWSSRLQEINCNKPAYRAGHLIQKAGSLVPVHILCIFSDMGISNGIHASVIEEPV